MKNKLVLIAAVSLSLNLFFIASQVLPNLIQRAVPAPVASNGSVNPPAWENNLFDEINPVSGYQINAKFGKLGPRMVKGGVIDLKKFKAIYTRSGQTLTPELEKILEQESVENIVINRDNSYFLLNFFWAVGLSNKSQILDNGEMSKYGGRADLGNFASTGGWTLSKTEAMNYYSSDNLIPLNPAQESLVKRVAENIYRPCCNNSTAFPDCNHGMALLGVLQLMAADDANEDEMYQAAKYFNAYWFPGNYYDLALYFKETSGKNFAEIDAKLLLSKKYSSASGWRSAKNWLIENGLQQEPPKQGGGCGV